MRLTLLILAFLMGCAGGRPPDELDVDRATDLDAGDDTADRNLASDPEVDSTPDSREDLPSDSGTPDGDSTDSREDAAEGDVSDVADLGESSDAPDMLQDMLQDAPDEADLADTLDQGDLDDVGADPDTTDLGDTCIPAGEACWEDGNVYEFDSCGRRGALAEACPEHADCATATCTCRNQWTGDDCDGCDFGYNWVDDCNGCAPAFADPACGRLACSAGLNNSFESWTDDQPDGVWSSSPSLTTGLQTGEVASGTRALLLAWSQPATLIRDGCTALTSGEKYTFHAWLWSAAELAGPGLFIETDAPSPETPSTRVGPASNGSGWHEITSSWQSTRDEQAIMGLAFQGGSGTITTDAWAITQTYAFDDSDGVSDDGVFVLAEGVDRLTVEAAINDEGELWVGTERATNPSDRIIYVWVGGAGDGSASPPWAKGGILPRASHTLFALVQEETNSFCSWVRHVPGETDWAAVASSSCSDSAGGAQLEGVIDLVTALGLDGPNEVPGLLGFAAAAYGTADSGALHTPSQSPPTTDSDEDLDADEIVRWHRAELLLGVVGE